MHAALGRLQKVCALETARDKSDDSLLLVPKLSMHTLLLPDISLVILLSCAKLGRSEQAKEHTGGREMTHAMTRPTTSQHTCMVLTYIRNTIHVHFRNMISYEIHCLWLGNCSTAWPFYMCQGADIQPCCLVGSNSSNLSFSGNSLLSLHSIIYR